MQTREKERERVCMGEFEGEEGGESKLHNYFQSRPNSLECLHQVMINTGRPFSISFIK